MTITKRPAACWGGSTCRRRSRSCARGRRAGGSSWIVGAATLASLALFYTKSVTVKLLPFDNKSEIAGGGRPARGLLAGGKPTGCCPQAAERLKALPELTSIQSYAGHGRAVQLQRPGAPLLLPRQRRAGRSGSSTSRPRPSASGTSHAIALEIRERLKGLRAPQRTVAEGGRGAAWTAGAVDAAGRGLWPRRPRRGARPRPKLAEDLRERAVHRGRGRQLRRPGRAGSASPSIRTTSNSTRSRRSDVYDTIQRLSGRGSRGLLPSRRGAASGGDRRAAAEEPAVSLTAQRFRRRFRPTPCPAGAAWSNWAMW